MAAVVAVVLVLAACDPIPHPVVVVREAATSPVTFRLLSGYGRYVVVTSTGPSATVPAAGAWRLDRTTGAAVSLPDAGVPRHISADGRRILLSDGTVWMSGAVFTPPAAAVFSPDLTAIAYVGPDGMMRSQRYPDGPVWAVEDGFPRPAGSTGPATAKAVADDGRTVQYLLPLSPLVRFIDLDAGMLVDRENGSIEAAEGYVQDWFALSADGSRFAHHHEEGTYDFANGTTDVGASWVELIDVATGATVTHWDSATDQQTLTLHIGAFGREAWVYQQRTRKLPDQCPGPASLAICVVASTAVAVRPGDVQVFAIAPGQRRTVTMSRNGRFLLVDNALTPYSGNSHVTVVDWMSRSSEALASPETYTETGLQCVVFGQSAPCTLPVYPSNAQISDSGRLVAAQAGTRAPGPSAGWYELSAAP